MKKFLMFSIFCFLFLFCYEIKAQQVVIQINKPFVSKNLSGVIVDPNGKSIAGVRVDLCSSNWLDRKETRETDEKGEFRFYLMPNGIHFLRISHKGFQELKIKIQVDRKSKKQPKIKMELAT